MFKSTLLRKQHIERLIQEYYEPGRQDRCKRWVYLHYVLKELGISERTFYRYLGEYEKRLQNIPPPKVIQLELFQ